MSTEGFVHTPPNEIKHIETVWAVVSLDEHGEGICGAMVNGRWMSLTTASERLVPALLHIARDVAKMTGKKLKLIKMTMREDIQDIIPADVGSA